MKDLNFLLADFRNSEYGLSDRAWSTIKGIYAIVESKSHITETQRLKTDSKVLNRGYRGRFTPDIMVPETAAYICLFLTNKDIRLRGGHFQVFSLTEHYPKYLTAVQAMIDNDQGEFFSRDVLDLLSHKVQNKKDKKTKKEKEGGARPKKEKDTEQENEWSDPEEGPI